MPRLEAGPDGFGRAVLAFVGYICCSAAVAGGVTAVLPNRWFLVAFLGSALLLLLPFRRLFRRVSPATPTAE